MKGISLSARFGFQMAQTWRDSVWRNAPWSLHIVDYTNGQNGCRATELGMTYQLSEFENVRKRVHDLGCELSEGIVLLPANFLSAASASAFQRRPEAVPLKALLRLHDVPVDEIATKTRQGYAHQNASEWIPPPLFIPASLISKSSGIVFGALTVLKTHLKDVIKRATGATTVKLEIIVERPADFRCRKICYAGDVKGIVVLINVIGEISAA